MLPSCTIPDGDVLGEGTNRRGELDEETGVIVRVLEL